MGKRIAAMVLGVALLLPVAGTARADDKAVEALIAQKCTLCHTFERVDAHKRDEAGWREVVTRMQKHASGLISDKEAETITEYLGRTHAP